jgi:hypothetical protein
MMLEERRWSNNERSPALVAGEDDEQNILRRIYR